MKLSARCHQKSSTQKRKQFIALHLNLALCAGKAGNYADVRTHTTDVLGADPDNVKALYRRGAAASIHGHHDEALADLYKALRLQPQDTAVRAEIQELRVKIKKQTESDKAMYAKSFAPAARDSAEAGVQNEQPRDGKVTESKLEPARVSMSDSQQSQAVTPGDMLMGKLLENLCKPPS